MWPELINNKSFPDDEELNYYLDADSNFYQHPVPAHKFIWAGQCFLDLAEQLDIESENWLRDWQNNSYGKFECVVNCDWQDWLASRTQQSVNVSFLSKYVIEDNRLPNDYPEERTTEKKEEIINTISTEETWTNLIEIAHREDIEQWSEIVFNFRLKMNRSVSFNQLIRALNLSSSQIYLGIILSDLFILLPDSNDFYNGFLIDLK